MLNIICLIWVTFCVVVRGANVIQVGLSGNAGFIKYTVQNVIGPVTYKVDPSAGQRISDFTSKYGGGLEDNEEVVTNEDNFVYPCGCDKTGYNYDCIREFFANNSDCSPVSGPVPEPLVLTQFTGFFPSVNVTGTYSNISFEGLGNATVCKFYYNKKTGNLVFAIEILVLYISSPKAYFTYRRPCRESIVRSGFSEVTYRSLIFTAIIPLVCPYGKLRLDLADISSYIKDFNPNNSNPDFSVEPSLTNSTNPVVIAEVNSLLAMLAIVNNELFYFLSQLLTAIYIQTNICDFGLELFSN